MVLSDFLNKAIPGGGPKKNFALRAKSCPLSFPISSLYRPYPFQYHPCIVIRPYPSPCILRSHALSISNPIPAPSSYILHKFVPVFFTTFSLYPCQYPILLILVYILRLFLYFVFLNLY